MSQDEFKVQSSRFKVDGNGIAAGVVKKNSQP
jgi:hypothetical protein